MVKRLPPSFVCYSTKVQREDAKEDEGITVILRVEGTEISGEQLTALKDVQDRLSAEVNDIMGWQKNAPCGDTEQAEKDALKEALRAEFDEWFREKQENQSQSRFN